MFANIESVIQFVYYLLACSILFDILRFCFAYFCLILIEMSFPYEHMPLSNKTAMSQILIVVVTESVKRLVNNAL